MGGLTLNGRTVVYKAMAAGAAWLALGVFVSRPWISPECGEFVGCSLLLYGLALFMWSAIGFVAALMWHYWRKN
jgi:hypothetical protein